MCGQIQPLGNSLPISGIANNKNCVGNLKTSDDADNRHLIFSVGCLFPRCTEDSTGCRARMRSDSVLSSCSCLI